MDEAQIDHEWRGRTRTLITAPSGFLKKLLLDRIEASIVRVGVAERNGEFSIDSDVWDSHMAI